MASTRLRKAFRYPSEDSDSDPDELDEEHQERLISDLQAQDAQKNETYRKAFTAIPLIATLFFLYAFIAAATAKQRLIALLSLSSLGCTAYILYFMPIQAPDRKGKKAVYLAEAEKGPVEKYLVYLDGTLAGLLLFAATLSWRNGFSDDAWREALPAGADPQVHRELFRYANLCYSHLWPDHVRQTATCASRPGRSSESQI